ncbi:MAG: SpoIIE family protein phosphatase [Bacteroidetes bacterium]|nr:SpoIIE family protein phosphatase [Bacteroidota bacterium]MBU1719142.1 SpoIIE family protein phosphatase [Bacteroidota bacterium]
MKKAIIICVDDESIVLQSLKTELKEAFPEFMIEIAEGGHQALELFDELTEEKCDIPLIISDYIMPDMKGDELLIKIHERSEKTMKIMLTGQATTEGVGNAINFARLYRYIPKPWEKDDFILTVREAARSFFQDKKLAEQNEELRILNYHLEEKVKERTAEIEMQKDIIELRNRNITASIRYAMRIQHAILPSKELIGKLIPDSFILFKPKDIVSGDFYWLYEKDDCVLFAAVDCTGHGVPGAFMSIVGHNLLMQAVSESNISEPAGILNYLSHGVNKLLRQDHFETTVKDGMDISLVSIDRKHFKLRFAGVSNPMYLVRNDEIIVHEPDRYPIGEPFNEEFTEYKQLEFDILPGDKVYVFSDGYIDQFGGPKRKKYLSKRLRELLLEIRNEEMEKQGHILNEKFEGWRGEVEQYDDVLIMGVCIPATSYTTPR